MPRTPIETDPELDTILMELEPHMRPTAAAARNASITKRRLYAEMLDAGKRERTHIRTLHVKYELSMYRIAKIVGLSESRVNALLDGVRRQRKQRNPR